MAGASRMGGSERNRASTPLVTVVTPSYNQGRFIRETIESVLSQDYPQIEYLVIDGGSTDDTLEILKSYDHRFFWVSEPDSGQTQAINKGWRLAKGEVLAWLNSDDVYLPGAVTKAVDFLLRNPQTGLVYGEVYHIAEDGRIMERFPTEPFDPKRLVRNNYISQPAVFVRHAAVKTVGLLDETLHYSMDYEFWLRIQRKYSLGRLPEYLALSRLHTRCKTISQRVASRKEVITMLHRSNGSVPASWVYDYASAVLEERFSYPFRCKNPVFRLGVMLLAGQEYLRYNGSIPLTTLRQWTSPSLRHNVMGYIKKVLNFGRASR